MIDLLLTSPTIMPLTFAALMGICMLVYAIMDGFDLGVGMLMPLVDDNDKDRMVSSIGPFWDANETWLVFGVGILLVAFPAAHGVILGELYLPVAIMLCALIVRGVAFDFRLKVHVEKKPLWNKAFFWGSFVAAFAQGFMLGDYILGFADGLAAFLFACIVGCLLCAGYVLIGACWLIIKTEKSLQKRAAVWAGNALYWVVAGIIIVSLVTPLASPRIFEKWFNLETMIGLAPIPLLSMVFIVFLAVFLRQIPFKEDRWNWVPFITTVGIYILCFQGMAYSFYPYIVPERLTIVESASAPESLFIILCGALLVVPMIIGYTVYIHHVFRGKSTDLSYD